MNKIAQSLKQVRSVFVRPVSDVVISELLEASLLPMALAERIQWAEFVLEWLTKDASKENGARYTRLKFLFHLFDRRPDWREATVRQLRQLLVEAPMLNTLAETGYASEHGLVHETARRILLKTLPAVQESTLLSLLLEVFSDDDDVQWFEDMPAELSERIVSEFRSESESLQAVTQKNAIEALAIVAIHLADQGLSTNFRKRSRNLRPTVSPFFRLLSAIRPATAEKEGLHSDVRTLEEILKMCRSEVESVYADMETHGTSVGLVYQLEAMTAAIDRVEQLSRLVAGEMKAGSEVYRFVVSLVKSVIESRWVIGHVSNHLHLISRKIAERNGDSGEHYIARTTAETRRLFVSAMWGGAIVVGMTLLKTVALGIGFPPLIRAFVIWVVYSGGFLLMQATHATLATKLPSFTASQLARKMKDINSSDQVATLVVELKKVFSSQAWAFLGNLVSLIPLAILCDLAWNMLFGRHLFSQAYALETIEGLHPLFSLAIPLGALTGVLLWISSLAGGWFENWIVYRNLPEAIESHRRVVRVFGADRAKQIGESIRRSASGFAANVSLGFLFAFVPFVGVIAGLPLESKHVTISSTGAVVSFMSIVHGLDAASLIATTVSGLVLVGVMNLAVSFAFALIVAARATAVDSRRFRLLLKLTSRAFFKRS
ncbi:site-specific recombinase [soil metagenome]